MTAFIAPADAPEMPSISNRPSSSNWSSTPQVKAPCAPPPCSARLMRLRPRLIAGLAAPGRGLRLNHIRGQALAALLASHNPLGAYEIIERIAPDAARLAPTTAYRALDFLREQGLVHRIESRNAFIACVHNHALSDLVVFLI